MHAVQLLLFGRVYNLSVNFCHELKIDGHNSCVHVESVSSVEGAPKRIRRRRLGRSRQSSMTPTSIIQSGNLLSKQGCTLTISYN